jgi:hypothetical protein
VGREVELGCLPPHCPQSIGTLQSDRAQKRHKLKSGSYVACATETWHGAHPTPLYHSAHPPAARLRKAQRADAHTLYE